MSVDLTENPGTEIKETLNDCNTAIIFKLYLKCCAYRSYNPNETHSYS